MMTEVTLFYILKSCKLEMLILIALRPRYNMDLCAKDELYFVHAATLDDKLQSVIIFTIQIFLIVIVAFLISSATSEYIGKIEAENDFPSIFFADEEHGIE